LIASTLKILFQKSKGQSISEFLSSANNDLCGNLAGQFITAQVIELNLKDKSLTLGNAGHPGLFRIRNNSIEIIEAKGRALGIRANADYKIITFPLMNKDRIYMVTDGLIEAKNESNQLLGEEGLKNILLKNSNKSILKAIPPIIEDILATTQENQFEDDATMIVIDWKI
jgi:serine phosphatase RsbU (regulator of sigma subunit)